MSLPSDFTILSFKLEARVAEEEGQAKVETSPEPEELSCVSPNMMSSVSPPRVEESPMTRPSIIVSRGDFTSDPVD